MAEAVAAVDTPGLPSSPTALTGGALGNEARVEAGLEASRGSAESEPVGAESCARSEAG
jgi:hypothetical protein